MIAVSLNVGDGVRLIKPAKLCMCTQTLQTQRGRTHGAGCVRQWFRTAEPLGERRYENRNTHTCRTSTMEISYIIYTGVQHYTRVRQCVLVNVQFEKGIRDIFVGVFVSSCVSNEKQTHPQNISDTLFKLYIKLLVSWPHLLTSFTRLPGHMSLTGSFSNISSPI